MTGKIKLIVAIEDEIYLDKLCDFLETCHCDFVTERFSDKTVLMHTLRSECYFDAILFEYDMLAESGMALINGIKILLSDKDCFQLANGCYSIREYQKADDVASAVRKICVSDKRFINREAYDAGKSKLYLFTSPVGGTGVTTVSFASAMHLARQGKKTLYINLEQFSSIASLLPADGKPITQVMRLTSDEAQNLSAVVESEKLVEPISGLEYFVGFRGASDIATPRLNHLQNLFAKLSSSGEYYAVIVDMAFNVELMSPLLESIDKVFLITRNTNLSIARVNSLLRYTSENVSEYQNKLLVIINALIGGCNKMLSVAPSAIVPMYQMIIDAANFPNAVFNSGQFSRTLSELARQL